jgi:hypothetical protein
MGQAVDLLYLQLATVIDLLASKEVFTPEEWEQKLEEVKNHMAKQIEERIKNDAAKDSGQDNELNPDGTDASEGSGKIITPNRKIIVPGQQ